MSIDSVTIERLRELAEASKAGGWQEVVAALDMGDIVLALRDDRGAVKAAQEATGLGRSTLWRRAKLAEHRELIEAERPANLSEALKLIKGAAAEEGQGEAKDKGGRPPVPAVVKLTKALMGAAMGLGEGAYMPLDNVLAAVEAAYREGAKVRAQLVAPPKKEAMPALGSRPATKAEMQANRRPAAPVVRAEIEATLAACNSPVTPEIADFLNGDPPPSEAAPAPEPAPKAPKKSRASKLEVTSIVADEFPTEHSGVEFSDGRRGYYEVWKDGSVWLSLEGWNWPRAKGRHFELLAKRVAEIRAGAQAPATARREPLAIVGIDVDGLASGRGWVEFTRGLRGSFQVADGKPRVGLENSNIWVDKGDLVELVRAKMAELAAEAPAAAVTEPEPAPEPDQVDGSSPETVDSSPAETFSAPFEVVHLDDDNPAPKRKGGARRKNDTTDPVVLAKREKAREASRLSYQRKRQRL